MRPTLLAPAVLLMAALMIPHCGGARLSAQPPAADPAPLAAITTLLEIDRAFSKTSSDLSMRAALDAMFADGVIAPWQRGEIVKGKAAVIRAMLQSPDSVAKLSWAPIRGGVSADGLHGFTFGYLAAKHPDGRLAHSKYMAYWVREPRGWRVAAWKRRPIGVAPLASAPLPPSLPRRLLKATTDGDVIARYYRSLVNAEAGFSQLAQRVGLSRAFADMGADDAVNMGGLDDPQFVVGPANIAKSVAPVNGEQPATITWGADTALVSSSGDLGITFGVIRLKVPQNSNTPAPGAAFFTIWRRASPSAPWRYIAE
ncbi:hypothetical protein [Gemmatimonas sp.]|uniref:hypothetical protein n=1 Tax=Gemmatimonas sp. TaxID=1962908 RepID=UPI0037BEEF00